MGGDLEDYLVLVSRTRLPLTIRGNCFYKKSSCVSSDIFRGGGNLKGFVIT